MTGVETAYKTKQCDEEPSPHAVNSPQYKVRVSAASLGCSEFGVHVMHD